MVGDEPVNRRELTELHRFQTPTQHDLEHAAGSIRIDRNRRRRRVWRRLCTAIVERAPRERERGGHPGIDGQRSEAPADTNGQQR